MNQPPRCFIELPAGLASVSLRLHGGPHCRPPVSRFGSKQGFAAVILDALGLHGGMGAGSFVWADADPDALAVLSAYAAPAQLAQAATTIKGWAQEQPRHLWDRLRAARNGRHELAAWLVLAAWTKGNDADATMYLGPDRPSTKRLHDPNWVACITTAGLAARCARVAQQVASMQVLRVAPAVPGAAEVAGWLGTPGDLSGCVVYAAPPYLGTSGYKAKLSREQVVAYAREFAALGAVVCVSEAQPLAELGWDAVEITGGRYGTKRAFSTQQTEWLTLNRSPAHRVAVQVAMFGP